jgi:hypothetical protein
MQRCAPSACAPSLFDVYLLHCFFFLYYTFFLYCVCAIAIWCVLTALIFFFYYTASTAADARRKSPKSSCWCQKRGIRSSLFSVSIFFVFHCFSLALLLCSLASHLSPPLPLLAPPLPPSPFLSPLLSLPLSPLLSPPPLPFPVSLTRRTSYYTKAYFIGPYLYQGLLIILRLIEPDYTKPLPLEAARAGASGEKKKRGKKKSLLLHLYPFHSPAGLLYILRRIQP